ncbi:MAG TPA: DUF4112 domain-containing protein [Pyrinomonadaceae bacterium]|nr:DUF4112 domain-containing protein [Pyrinomonadaceae bacterium]
MSQGDTEARRGGRRQGQEAGTDGRDRQKEQTEGAEGRSLSLAGVGDFATTAVSLYILAAGVRYRVPKVTLLRMGANIAVDYLLGSIPVVGDIFDAAWKSNQMNVELLRRRAAVSAEEAARGRTSDWLFLAGIVLVLLILFFATLALSLWLLWLVASTLR